MAKKPDPVKGKPDFEEAVAALLKVDPTGIAGKKKKPAKVKKKASKTKGRPDS